MPFALLLMLVAWMMFVNLLAYALFRADKQRAIAGAWRIPESQLLLVSALGGSLGARAGQILLRHKTRKQPFRSLLNVIVSLQLAVLALVVALMLSPALSGQARALALSLLLPEVTMTDLADVRRPVHVTIRRGTQ